MIQIMKASAGSGKTFTLAKKYIIMLFTAEDRFAYRHILAVTFTNKATDEMKSRILKELYILSVTPEKSGYFKDFVPSLAATADELGRKAEDILCNILHDYGAFAISTIDRFFQRTLKAFSREIGQFASYQVELDRDSLVAESVDRILDSLTEQNSGLLQWLTDSVMEQIESGGRYVLDKSLKDMAKRLCSIEHRDQIEKWGIDEDTAYSKETLSLVRNECRSVIAGFYAEVREAASRIIDLINSSEVSPKDSSYKFLEKLYDWAELKNGDKVPVPTEKFVERATDPDKWFPKNKAKTLLPKVYPLLETPLNDFCALFELPYAVFSTAKIIDSQLYGLGVAGELNKTFNALMKEKNVLCLDDSNTILRGIIDGSDAPFIYEKLGVKYEHFLLDEFQDTARIQWENFRPLLQNSQAQGFDNLIVGDVKQSIYRWRGSDWNLLDSELEKEFTEVKTDTLQSNYRSLANIVEFNNAFFSAAAALLDNLYGQGGERRITDIYSDAVQKTAVRGDEEGSVTLTWCEKKDEALKVLDAIAEIRSSGAEYGDIAVLVRNNSSGESIASFLIDNNVPVITDDSLRVRSSLVVRRLASLLSYADNPDNTLGSFLASSLDVVLPEEYHSIIDLAEDLLRQLRSIDADVFDGETLYIQSFMDVLHDYVSVNGNSLCGFLKHWDEINPSISSPTSGDSVRVMTIHKSKGLDFPYVIFPYAEAMELYKPSNCWCRPNTDGTRLNGLPEVIYDVLLSKSSNNTLFSEDYRKEIKMQYVDNINTFYVALTRASKGMHIITQKPSAAFLKELEKGKQPGFSDMSMVLYWFLSSRSEELGFKMESLENRENPENLKNAENVENPENVENAESGEGKEDGGRIIRYVKGKIFDFAGAKRKSADAYSLGGRSVEMKTGYPSWPISGRLLFKTDGADFFSEDGTAGVSASHRLRGIVLHDILSEVRVPSDLAAAVVKARAAGRLTELEAEDALDLLSRRIASAAKRGWFPEDASAVRNEVSLIDTDGSVHRPDRMVFSQYGSVVIVDYKFGAHRPSYARQIASYADICSRMGYKNIAAALWYVDTDEVIMSS